jgi:hypothetical protein
MSRFAALVLRAYALVAAAALILNSPALGVIVGLVGIVHGIVISMRTYAFGALMHRIIETVALRQHLAPLQAAVDPPARAA